MAKQKMTIYIDEHQDLHSIDFLIDGLNHQIQILADCVTDGLYDDDKNDRTTYSCNQLECLVDTRGILNDVKNSFIKSVMVDKEKIKTKARGKTNG